MTLAELRKEHEVTVSTLEAKLAQLKRQIQKKQEEVRGVVCMCVTLYVLFVCECACEYTSAAVMI